MSDEVELTPAGKQLAQYLQGYFERSLTNLNRVSAIAKLDKILFAESEKLSLLRGDILRSAVVLLHATLEDFLRYVGQLYLPYAEEESLNRIALVGSTDMLRAEKFYLGRLASHRNRTVHEVICDSVSAHLNRVSFSDTNDVARLLDAVGIDVDTLRPSFPTLNAMMKRRHQIVHCGDLIDGSGSSRETTTITAASVEEWKACVTNFIGTVIAYKVAKEFAPLIQAEQKLLGTKSAINEPSPIMPDSITSG